VAADRTGAVARLRNHRVNSLRLNPGRRSVAAPLAKTRLPRAITFRP
jgi:hypothetical protein